MSLVVSNSIFVQYYTSSIKVNSEGGWEGGGEGKKAEAPDKKIPCKIDTWQMDRQTGLLETMLSTGVLKTIKIRLYFLVRSMNARLLEWSFFGLVDPH